MTGSGSRASTRTTRPTTSVQRALSQGEDAEPTYRLLGLDGVTRLLWDRARPRRDPGGAMRVAGIISDVTSRNEAAARLAEASERFARLLDVVGAHVYVLLAFPDGRFEELFQGPGPTACSAAPCRIPR